MKVEPMSRGGSHWQAICPRAHYGRSGELIGTYQKTAIALQNPITDVNAAIEADGQSVTEESYKK